MPPARATSGAAHAIFAPAPPRQLLWGQYKTAYGFLQFAFLPDGRLARLDFADTAQKQPPRAARTGRWAGVDYTAAPPALVEKTWRAIAAGTPVRLALYGSPFQLKVWRALLGIPAGETCSYGDIAKKLKTGARGVGQAVGRNPISIAVPCHRVLNSKGALHGFGGGLARKALLLKAEGWKKSA